MTDTRSPLELITALEDNLKSVNYKLDILTSKIKDLEDNKKDLKVDSSALDNSIRNLDKITDTVRNGLATTEIMSWFFTLLSSGMTIILVAKILNLELYEYIIFGIGFIIPVIIAIMLYRLCRNI